MDILLAALSAFTAAVILVNTISTGMIARRSARNAANLTKQAILLTEIHAATNGTLEELRAQNEVLKRTQATVEELAARISPAPPTTPSA